MGYRLNGDHWDPQILDPDWEWSEAIGCLKRIESGIVSSSCTERDYISDGHQEYLADNNMRLEVVYRTADSILTLFP